MRQARELLGWTQTELGKKAGLAQPQVSALEAGATSDEGAVERIAAATGFGIRWFEQGPPEELPDGSIRYRKRSRATKKDDRRAIRRLEISTELLDGLSTSVRLPPVTFPYVGDQVGEDIEFAADRVREAMGVPARGPIRNLIRSAERSGILVVGLPVDFGPTGRLQHHHGVSAWVDLDGRPLIGFSTHDPGDRQRHTIGHELGHLALHRGLEDPDRNYESEASHFAGALLMPYEDALDAFRDGVTLRSLARLKVTWGISIAALAFRARQVGAINGDRLESLFKQISARGWRTSEPVTVHREQPALMPRLLEATFGEPIDWLAVSQVLAVPPHLLKEIACVATRDVVYDEADGPSDLIYLDQRRRA